MTTMIRYQPWALHRELFNEFNRYINGDGNTGNDASSGATSDWSPAVDIEEYADRSKAAEAEGVERRRVERATGRLYRRFSLPETVDSEAVTAKNANGVLEVVIPKRPTAQPRRITVNN